MSYKLAESLCVFRSVDINLCCCGIMPGCWLVQTNTRYSWRLLTRGVSNAICISCTIFFSLASKGQYGWRCV